jgi:hypothetical protein
VNTFTKPAARSAAPSKETRTNGPLSPPTAYPNEALQFLPPAETRPLRPTTPEGLRDGLRRVIARPTAKPLTPALLPSRRGSARAFARDRYAD